jgi:hypothetical protein
MFLARETDERRDHYVKKTMGATAFNAKLTNVVAAVVVKDEPAVPDRQIGAVVENCCTNELAVVVVAAIAVEIAVPTCTIAT